MVSLIEFEFPDTGEGVTEGKFLEWLVEEGEEVEEDQPVAEVETDKAVVDVPSPSTGTIKELKVKPGDTVEVGEVILTMDAGGDTGKTGEGEMDEPEEDGEEAETGRETEIEGREEDSEEKGKGREKGEKKEDIREEPRQISSADVLALPAVRRLAREKGIELSEIKGSGPGGRITEADVEEASGGQPAEKETRGEGEEVEKEEVETAESGTRASTPGTPEDVKATPGGRKLAREKRIELSKIEGSGREGKITREDVMEAAEGEGSAKKGKKKAVSARTESEGRVEQAEHGEVERVEMNSVKRATAEKMAESKFTAPHVTHIEKADVTKLVEMREEKKDEVDVHLTYLPFIMKATMLALKEFPGLNAELDEENQEIIRKRYYDFNIAVDTDKGLLVPVIEDVGEKNILELAEDIVDKAGKAKGGELSREEMQGGTFSITNIGAIGGKGFTPIINYPQTAILGIGKIEETAEVVEGEVVPRHTVELSLSYDHRVVDGATAARFLNRLVENLEDPEHMLMEL